MEELIKSIQPQSLPVDWMMVILVMLSGIFQNRYLINMKMTDAWKTLIVSFIFCSVYGFLISMVNGFKWQDIERWFFSYVLATSLYDLFIKVFKQKFGIDK